MSGQAILKVFTIVFARGKVSMPLDPQTSAILQRLESIHFVLTRGMTPQQARKRQRALAHFTAASTPEPVARVEDRSIPGPAGEIPLRIYTPAGAGPFPLLIYFHSGGGVLGDLDTEDALCRRLANLAECLVLSVGYHLAPEYKFPTGQEECYTAACWAAQHAVQINGNPARIAVGGMSAGANLAAVVTHMARDRGFPALTFQLLLAPLTDFRLRNSHSLEMYGEGYLLTKEDILWFMNHFLENEEDRLNPLASPYLALTLANLPPALIITAEYDPLRDDGERYGRRLLEDGVPATISRRRGAIHGFVVPNQLEPVLVESASALRAAFFSETLCV